MGESAGLIGQVIDEGNISTLFQPVVCIDTKGITGFEAFSRGKINEQIIKSSELFECRLENDKRFTLDALCCLHSLKGFHKFLAGHPWLRLFLNIDGRPLEYIEFAKHFLCDITKKSEVSPSNIVVEIGAELLDCKSVKNYMLSCRDEGYQLSIDKVHKRTHTMELVLEIKPEFIKFSSDVWADPADPLYNIDNLKLLVRSCSSIGCQSIGMGVESEDDALYLLQCGINMHQGYYYTKNHTAGCDDDKHRGEVLGFIDSVEHIHAKYRQHKKELITQKKELFDSRHKMMRRIASKFSSLSPGEFEGAIKGLMESWEDAVSAFIVDEKGVQITNRIPFNSSLQSPKNLESIRTVGRDHSTRDFHLHLLLGYERFVCPLDASPFLPQQTTIVAARFFSGHNKIYILCVEFK